MSGTLNNTTSKSNVKKCQSAVSYIHLLAELWVRIFEPQTQKQLKRLCKVCKYFRQVARPILWAVPQFKKRSVNFKEFCKMADLQLPLKGLTLWQLAMKKPT